MRAVFYASLVLCTSLTLFLPGQAASPTGISFDQIDRFGFGKSSEAFGSFRKDRAALVAAGSQSRFPAANGSPSQQILGSAMLGMTGTLLHYAYLDGMTRIDDPIQNTATITRPDLHQVLYLNLAKNTYTVAQLPARRSPTIPPEMQRTLDQLGASQPHPHGTGIETVRSTTVTLPSTTYETFAATGSRSAASTSIYKATGACHNMNMHITVVQYDVPQLEEPPIDRGSVLKAHAVATMPRRPMRLFGGCQPKRVGATPELKALGGKSFNVYREVETRSEFAGIVTPVSFYISERGNIRRLTEADRGLFSAPADFTKETP